MRESVIEDGGAWAPTAPLSATEPLAPGLIVKALAAPIDVESIVALKIIADVEAVELKVVAIFNTTGAL